MMMQRINPTIKISEPYQLSKRQSEVLVFRASGFLNKQIADKLGISEYTVKEHISLALRKMHVRSVEQAIVHLVKQGIIN